MAKSNLHRMISIPKLYAEGKMYMNAEEIQAIQNGKLREYLSQFLDSNNHKLSGAARDSSKMKSDLDDRPQSPIIPL